MLRERINILVAFWAILPNYFSEIPNFFKTKGNFKAKD